MILEWIEIIQQASIESWVIGIISVAVLSYIFRSSKRENINQNTKSPNITNKANVLNKSCDDDIMLVNETRRTKSLSFGLKSSIRRWLYSFKRSKRVDVERKGDGLHSIFSGKRLPDSPSLGDFGVRPIYKTSSPNDLSFEQNLILQCLYKWGVFASFEKSLLDGISSRTSKLTKNKNEVIFTSEDTSDSLLILISGSCSVVYRNDDGTEVETSEIIKNPGDSIGSIIDIIAWILRSSTPRQLTIRCLEPCEVLVVPSPRDSDGQYASRSHWICFGRILQLLLIRLNRTTIATAFFYMGLAELMLPSFRPIQIPKELKDLLSGKINNDGNNNDNNAQSIPVDMEADLLPMITSCVTSLLTPDLSQLAHAHGKNRVALADLSSEATCLQPFPVMNISPDYTMPTAGGMLRRAVSLDSSASYSSYSSKSDPSLSATSDLNALYRTFQCPPGEDQIPSLRSLFKPSSTGLSSGKEQALSIVWLDVGQSLLSVAADVVPGVYIIVLGEMLLEYVGGRSECATHRGQHAHSDNIDVDSGLCDIVQNKTKIVLREGCVLGHIAFIAGTSEEWYGRRGGSSTPMLRCIALSKVALIRVPRLYHEKFARTRPEAFVALSERIIQGLPPIIRLFDFSSDLVKKDGGEDLVVAGGSASGSLYVLLTGKLRCIAQQVTASTGAAFGGPQDDLGLGPDGDWDHNASRTSAGSLLGRGVLIGGSEALTGQAFSHTVRTMRACTLTRIPRTLLAFVIRKYPTVLLHLIRNASVLSPLPVSGSVGGLAGRHGHGQGSRRPLCKTVAVLAVTCSVPLDLFCSLLCTAMGHGGVSTKLLTSSFASGVFGRSLETMGDDELHLSVGPWMQSMESDHDIVLFQCDSQEDSLWNQLCIAHADELLLVANGNDGPQIGAAEYSLSVSAEHLPKTLVLLHVDPGLQFRPKDTRHWVELRSGVRRHLHVRLHSSDLLFDAHNYRSDFARLARVMCNMAIGVVLGGGGARGMSHIGVLQALEEAHIPVDFIGGTSMGAFVGALYAAHGDSRAVHEVAQRWASGMGSLWSYFKDLTLPVTSYFNGYNFTSALRRCFGSQKIEDLWLGYFCVTTDLTSHRERVHVNGTSWRYIRASMSLANFLPPVCDVDRSTTPHKCHYLVDGGYVNNLPVDVMRRNFGADIVISVDVSGDWSLGADYIYDNEGLSGLSVFLSTINPFGKTQNVPSMAQIASQLAYVSASKQIEHTIRLSDLYLCPPVHAYSMFDIPKMEEIRRIGYECARSEVSAWRARLKSDQTDGHAAGEGSSVRMYNAKNNPWLHLLDNDQQASDSS